MKPDFDKSTIDILAKRAGFLCSNPDCRCKTVGPNSNPDKVSLIGEAAHIEGARPVSKRYREDMTDQQRGSLTNAIWLCRNCHKLIDSDSELYSVYVLFDWRRIHEEYVLSDLGNKTDQIVLDEQKSKYTIFESYPHIVQRLVLDKPTGWEYSLTAAILRARNEHLFNRLGAIRDGLVYSPSNHISSEETLIWLQHRNTEMINLVEVAVKAVDRLNVTWGEPGVSGDEIEIEYACGLISNCLVEIIKHEEKLHFTHLSEEFDGVLGLIKGLIGDQIERLKEIPNWLDEIVEAEASNQEENALGSRRIIERTLVVDIPEGWHDRYIKELKSAMKKSRRGLFWGIAENK